MPDLAVYRRKRYTQLPAADDVPLVIAVADSTIISDRRYKVPRYATAGIAEAWLVDLNGQTVERYTEPRDGRYVTVAVAGHSETLRSTVFPSLAMPVAAVLGTSVRKVADENG